MDSPDLIQRAIDTSVQKQVHVTREGGLNYWSVMGGRGYLLPAFGTRARLFKFFTCHAA